MSHPSPLFPIFVKLADRPCLVVGGGTIAEAKVESLLTAGAAVTVISPKLTEQLDVRLSQKAFGWIPRRFEPWDLEGAFLVIAATSDDAVNDLVFREAQRRGVLCNAVDQPARCDFYFPAVVQRGDLQIAISTAGHSPSLAQRLRKDFEAQFGPEYADWLQWLGAVRQSLMARGLSFQVRKRLLGYLARRESFQRWRAGNKRRLPLREAA
jgi:precorrin-2 dehydrogenase / sirohydrochlorin ferrochelatase